MKKTINPLTKGPTLESTTPRSVIITGAGSGIGRGIARAFVDADYQVYASDWSPQRLDETVEELGAPANLRTRVLDVTDYEAINALVAEVVADTGQLDVFINNAGLFDGYADVLETEPELWSKIIGVNLTGSFYGCKAAARVMV